jgi:hypothetical protein
VRFGCTKAIGIPTCGSAKDYRNAIGAQGTVKILRAGDMTSVGILVRWKKTASRGRRVLTKLREL